MENSDLEFSKIADQLVTQSFAVVDHFLSQDEVNGLREEFEELLQAGSFKAASTGHRVQPASASERPQFRTDQTHWFEENELSGFRRKLWLKIERLREFFNQSLYLGLSETEGHFALYGPGGFYARHLDAFAANNARVVSVVLYLNSAWTDQDGGALILYPPGESAHRIVPTSGKLVCFISEKMAHEVELAHRPRYSFAAWMRRCR